MADLPLVAKLRLLNSSRVRFLLEAAAEQLLAAYWVRFCPFRVFARQLGRQGGAVGTTDDTDAPVARDVGWAMQAVARRTPWTSTCLMQAVAAQRMLRRRGIAATVYLAMCSGEKGRQNPLLAHAWVRCGSRVVTGQCDESQYRVIATFA